jgi:CheY-like chemotaxis protein
MAKILLVEDDKSLREIYGVRLMAEGYEIVSAGDGEEALAMAIKERPELIVSDVMMPKISGFDMLDILRSTTETKDVKVIMMTALSSDDQRARGEALGADRYLVKSQVGIEDVVRTVHDVLGDNLAPAKEAPSVVSEPMPAPEPQTVAPAPVAFIPSVENAPEPTPVPMQTPVEPRPIAPAPVEQATPAPAMPSPAAPVVNMTPPAPQPQPMAAAPAVAPSYAPEPMAATPPVAQPVFNPTPAAAPQPMPVTPAPAGPATTAPVDPAFTAVPTPAPAAAPIMPDPAMPAPVTQPAQQPVVPQATLNELPTSPAPSLPQPTAPFSTPAPASLGERVIEPLTNFNATPANDIASQIEQALNAPAPANPTPPVPPTV